MLLLKHLPVNCLLLRGSVDIHTDISYIAYQQLAELLTDYLFQTQSSASQDANLEQIVMDVVGVIPRLRTGIDVNVKFHSCDSFEYTVELSAFDAFRVRLLHGWIIDPSNALLASTIDGLSYNQLVDLLVTTEEVKASSGESWEPTHSVTELPSLEKETEDIPAQSVEGAAKEPFVETVNTEQIGNVAPVVASTEQHNLSENMEMEETKDDNTKDGEEAMTLATSCHQVSEIENIVSDKEATKMETETEATTNLTTQHSPRTKAAIIREFLTETSNQLTVYGLEELHKSVGEDELCVFFRNNHFSTITKHGGNLYLLISDIGFADEKDVIWEKICSIDGDSEFVNADFEPIQYGATRDSLPTTTTVGTSLDEQLAAQLQAQVNQQSNVSSQHMEDTDYQLAKKLQEEEQRKKPVTTNRKSPSRISSRTSPKTSPTKLSSSDRKSSGCSIQ